MTRIRNSIVIVAIFFVVLASVAFIPLPAESSDSGATPDPNTDVNENDVRTGNRAASNTTPTSTPTTTSTSDEPRIVPERGEEGEESEEYGEESSRTFQVGPNTSILTPSRPPLSQPLIGHLRGPRTYDGAHSAGEAYDIDLQWEQVGPTGFGLYDSVDLIGVSNGAEFNPRGQPVIEGDEFVIARAGGRGGVWAKNSTNSDQWRNIAANLESPYRIADVAVDPTDRNHIYITAPAEDKTRFALYESNNGGDSWHKVDYFENQQPLVDDDRSNGFLGRGARIHVFENGNVFLYNYDRNNYGYYSTDNGQTWNTASISISSPSRPQARNQLVFTNNGNGLLNPSGNAVYRTTDYGQSWTKVNDYSSANSFEFGLSGDGQTLYVAYKTGGTCCMLDKSVDGGSSWTTTGPISAFPRRGPQGLTVDPDDPSNVTVFIYMKGPYETHDGGDSWDRLFNNQLTVGHGYFYNTKSPRKNEKPERGMAKPVDYRDVQVIDELEGDPVLIGSDQGLFLMSHPAKKGGYVAFLNAGAMMDNGEVYNVEVDKCGNLYHGLWHHSTMIRKAPNPNQFAPPTNFYYESGPGGYEAGAMVIKDKSPCFGWATRANSNLKHYISNKSGTVKRYSTGANINYADRPVHVGGDWFYSDSSTWNLQSRTLSSSSTTQHDTNVRMPKEDWATDSVWYATDYSQYSGEPENLRNPRPQKIKQITGPSSSPQTHMDLTGSSLEIDIDRRWNKPHFDVKENRLAVVVQDSRKGNEEDIVIVNTTKQGTITENDISVSNPFGGRNIHEVFVDPTDPERYYATVVNDDPQCPNSIMVTQNGGNSWEKFSKNLDCMIVYDMAFNDHNDTVYVATHGRGVLKGYLGSEMRNPYAVHMDRFDPHFDQQAGKVVANDNRSTPADIGFWKHERAKHHLVCPDDPKYKGGEQIIATLNSQGENCARILFEGSSDAPLSAKEVYTKELSNLTVSSDAEEDYFNISIPELDSPLMKDKLQNPECGTNQVEMEADRSDKTRKFDPKKGTGTPRPNGGNSQSQSETVTKTVKTHGELVVTVRSKENSLSPFGIEPQNMDVRGYRNDAKSSRVSAATIERSNDAVTMRIPCPKSNQGLQYLIVAIGEQDQTVGGYVLNMTYQIDITRPNDIQNRGTVSPQNTPSSTGTTTSGFGIEIALAAFLAVALIARRYY